MIIRRWSGKDEAVTVLHFDGLVATKCISLPEGRWIKWFDSADKPREGPGSQVPSEAISEGEVALSLSPHAFVLFIKERRS